MRTVVAELLGVPFLCLLFCTGTTTAFCMPAPQSSPSVDQDFQKAMAAEDRGELDIAESLLVKIHSAHPGLFPVDESLGLLYAEREDYSRALPLLKAAAAEKPSSDVAHANFGAALYKAHHNPAAAAEFERAVKLNPRNQSALQSLGRIKMEEHLPAEAANALIAALALQPGDPDLQLDCASALLDAGRLQDAEKILTDFTDADNSARAQSLLGEADELKKDFAGAGTHLARAVELEPNEENAWMLGQELLRHWTFSAAAVELQAASLKFPASVRLRLGLAAALFGDQKYAAAIPVFAALLDADANNANYADMLGIACSAVMTEAPSQCGSLVRYAVAHPLVATASVYAADYLVHQSDAQEQRPLARKLIQAALNADPRLPEAQFQMGTFLQSDGMWAESIPYLQRAVELKPDFSDAHYHLGLAYWRTGRKQDGQAEMELQKKFSKQEQQDLDRRLRQIATFVVDVKN